MEQIAEADRDRDAEAFIAGRRSDIIALMIRRLESVGFSIDEIPEAAQAAIVAGVETALAEGYNLGAESIAFQAVDKGCTVGLALQPIAIEDVWERHWAKQPERTIGGLELDYLTVEALERAFPTIGDLERDG